MILYYLTLLLIPFNNHPLLAYNYAGFTPVKVVGGLSFLWAVAWFFVGQKKGRIASSANSWFLIFATLFFLLFMYHADFYNPVALQRFTAICIFYVTTVILLDSGRKLLIAGLTLIAALDIASAYMVREYLAYNHLYENFRPGGIFGDPNYFAASAVAVLPLAIFMASYFKSRAAKAFCIGSACAMAAAIALSQSRGGLIGLAAVCAVTIYEFRKYRKAAFALALTLAIAFFLSPANPIARFQTEETGTRVSTESRLELLLSGIEMVKARPLAGVGPGNFHELSGDYNENVRKNQLAHNSYLEIAAELGIPALIVFLVLCAMAFRDIARTLKSAAGDASSYKTLLLGLRTGLIGFLAAALFLSAEYEKVLWLYLFFAIAATRLANPLPLRAPARSVQRGAQA